MTHYEQALQGDIDRIKRKVTEMAGLVDGVLTACLQALVTNNRQMAYSVILRDQRIDELEKEIDRLCLEFIVRQQPVAGTLRFAYATIKINADLERVGDYAESVARHILDLSALKPAFPVERFTEIASHAIPMLRDAVMAFVRQDAALAEQTMDVEDIVDTLRGEVNDELVNLHKAGKLQLEALSPLMIIVNRFERVADQARSICQEVIYMCTGEYTKHPGSEAFRLLFVDEHNHCRSRMAEAIGNSLGHPNFIFSSAGLDPRPVDPRTIEFMHKKGLEMSPQSSKGVEHIPHLDRYQIIVALSKAAENIFPPSPTKVVALSWNIPDPTKVQGSEAEATQALESTYDLLRSNVQALIDAVLGDKVQGSPSP